jgi:hypothetical protein
MTSLLITVLVAMVLVFRANSVTVEECNPFQIPQSSTKPFCYSQKYERSKPVEGSWISSNERQSKYWNLTDCPLLLSKETCSHFGDIHMEHAEYAARLKFEPKDCQLFSQDDMLRFFSTMNLRIIFIGNSLTRQVIEGIACNSNSMGLVEKFELDWFKCEGTQSYPCHGSINCIECGEHSGFHPVGAKMYFAGGTTIEIVESYDTEKGFHEESGKVDLVITQKWHLEERGMIKFVQHRKDNSLPLPKLIYWHGYNAHFPTGAGLQTSGLYNVTELELSANKGGPKQCIASSGDPSSRPEIGKDLIQSWPLDGFFQVQGVNGLGSAKVGGNLPLGRFGDCQHFCGPGPASVISYAKQKTKHCPSQPVI